MNILRLLLCAVCGAIAPPYAWVQQSFPEWRGSTVLLPTEWEASPIVAVGEVTNATSYGEQEVGRLPWPMSPNVHKLYWCTGDFRITAVVKGALRMPTKKYLWASASPGCKLWPDDPALAFARFQTRVWFLREEGDFLRPTFDSGTRGFIGLFARWSDDPPLASRETLGALLLTPSANSDTLQDYAHYLWDVGDIACELLGKAVCTRRITDLAGLGNPALREEACNFLRAQLGAGCSAK